MKKFLLFAAVCACFSASAQNYTASATTELLEDWAPNYDTAITIDHPIEVEAYDNYVIIKGWLGDNPAQDLKVCFDTDENITSVTPITNGIEGDTTESGYAAFTTKSESYYYAQIYLGEGYDYAYSDDEGGYVSLSGYFYTSSTTYTWAYYYIAWEHAGTPLFSTTAKAKTFEDWDATHPGGALLPGNTIDIDVYSSYVLLKNWAGGEGHDLRVDFNQDAMVTSVTPIVNGEAGEAITTGTAAIETGNPQFGTVSIVMDEGSDFAYASAAEGYVLLSINVADAAGTQSLHYFYVEFENNGGGISAIENADAPTVYYNLNGMRIDNPRHGQVVIRRSGDKASKVIIR